MHPHSAANTQTRTTSIIAVVGGIIMDLVFETERMPKNNESLDALSLAYKPGGQGSNSSIAIYRAQHNNPANSPIGQSNVADALRSKPIHEEEEDGTTSSSQQDQVGVEVYLNTAVGGDSFGHQLKENLVQNGVNVSGVRKAASEKTGTCAVFVDKFTGNSRDIGHPGANTNWTPRKPDSVECLAGGYTPDLIVTHLETKRETIEQVLETAYKNGIDTLLNPFPVTYLLSSTYKHVTHLLINEKEAAELSGLPVEELSAQDKWGEAARYFLGKGVKYVVITVGEEGAYYATEETNGHVPAVKDVAVKDTTGAGDTFVGNYALEYVRQKQRGEWDIRRAVERGCKAAARTIEQLGAQESIPWADEIIM